MSDKLTDDLNTLLAIKDQLDSPKANEQVEAARIHNPVKEVSGALSGFLTAQLEKIQSDSQFTDLIRMHLRQRMGEASFDQLMELLHTTSADTTAEMRVMAGMFKNEQSGKTVIDTLRDSEVSSTAAKLYSEADSKDILQALTYFNQVTAKMLPNQNVIQGEAESVGE